MTGYKTDLSLNVVGRSIEALSVRFSTPRPWMSPLMVSLIYVLVKIYCLKVLETFAPLIPVQSARRMQFYVFISPC